jgi:hypothetical protein
MPSGMGMAGKIQNRWYINVYAPSGAEKREERERFCTTDLVQLLPTSGDELLLGRDFNCVLRRADAMGTFTYSKALETVRGLHLKDTWDQAVRPAYTHYTRCGRKVMRLATLCTNRQRCCLPLHMAVSLSPAADSVQV